MPLLLELYHGRKVDPITLEQEQLDDWGTNGPIFDAGKYVHGTYASDLKFEGPNDHHFLRYFEDLVYYDDVFYGDFTVFYVDELNDEQKARLVPFEEEKASLARYQQSYAVVSYEAEDEEGIPMYLYENDGDDDTPPDGGWVADLDHATLYTLEGARKAAEQQDDEYLPNEVHEVYSKYNHDGTSYRSHTVLVDATP